MYESKGAQHNLLLTVIAKGVPVMASVSPNKSQNVAIVFKDILNQAASYSAGVF